MELTIMKSPQSLHFNDAFDEMKIVEFKTVDQEKLAKEIELEKRLDTARARKPRSIKPDKLTELFNCTVKEFHDTNNICLAIAAEKPGWGPESHLIEGMEKNLNDLQYWKVLATIRAAYEGETFCGCDAGWWYRKAGSITDVVVGLTAIAILAKDPFQWVYDTSYPSSLNVSNFSVTDLGDEESSIRFGLEEVDVGAVETPSYLTVGIIALSSIVNKVREAADAKAAKFTKSLEKVEDLVSTAAVLIPEMKARIELWKRCSKIHHQKSKLTKKQLRQMKSAQAVVKKYGGRNDPGYLISKNVLLSERPGRLGKRVNIPNKETGYTFKLAGLEKANSLINDDTDRCKGAGKCSPCLELKNPALTLEDLLNMDKRLTSTRIALAKLIVQANSMTEATEARESNYLFLIEGLMMHLGTLKDVFARLDTMDPEDLQKSKSSRTAAIVIQSVLELSSFVVIVVSEIREELGVENTRVQAVSLTAFSVGFVFSRISDLFSSRELSRLQIVKEVKRLNGLRCFKRDIERLLTIFQVHESYRLSVEDIERKKAFNSVLDITRFIKGPVLGVNIKGLKENLALSSDADIECLQFYKGNEKTRKMKKNILMHIQRIRSKVARKVKSKEIAFAMEEKYNLSNTRREFLNSSPQEMSAADLDSESPKAARKSFRSIPHRSLERADVRSTREVMRQASRSSLESKDRSPINADAFADEPLGERRFSFANIANQRVNMEYMGQRNRSSDWYSLYAVDEESFDSEGNTDSDSTARATDFSDTTGSETEHEECSTPDSETEGVEVVVEPVEKDEAEK